ncbi:26S proteasome subunit P45 [Ramicandelaber brevisporus]|nr:26S proteasome subunit P45 [Ramicandelaber brevisporus]
MSDGGISALERAAQESQDLFADIDADIRRLSPEEIMNRTRLIDSEISLMKNEYSRLQHEESVKQVSIRDNQQKIKLNRQLPYLVSNVVEILDVAPDEGEEEDGGAVEETTAMRGKSAVVKTTTRSTVYLPMVGLVDPDTLRAGDLVGVNKDSYLILEALPTEYDHRAKAMEVDERPSEDYGDIGGLDKQITELVEAVVLPVTHADKFKAIGIKAPKGVLMYGPPGTGKTLMARACAAQSKATFLKLAGPSLCQMYVGDGARIVRDAFALAKEKAPTILFIDEIDAIGTKRYDSDKGGDRETQRTMMELLSQLDGFSSDDRIKIIAATNRIDTLDPALLRSGRLDRKIEFPLPNEVARSQIMQIHSRKMNVSPKVNFDELARACDEFNGAQCKAACVEAGMIALRRNALQITHEDFVEGIEEVYARKKTSLQYFA